MLSGRENTRLRLARAVAAGPNLLLVDEPLSGLDDENAARSLAALRRHLPNAVLNFALHDSEDLPEAHNHPLSPGDMAQELTEAHT